MKKLFITILFLTVCINGISQETEERYVIKNLSINDNYSNFGTSLFGENQMIFAMPAKRNYIINNTWTVNSQPFLDLYIGDILENGELDNVKKFSNKLNTKFHESNVTFTRNKKTVYFTRSNFYEGKYGKDSLGLNRLKLFKANVGSNNEWLNIVPMNFNSDNYSCGHPTLSEDGKTLYFVSDMPGTIGKSDIFKVKINSDGTYGVPENMGPEINTKEREMFPFIDGNDELYFSTDGREGFGMLDIYLSKITPYEVYTPINLGANINSKRDDFAFIIDKEKRSGYFSSNRIAGRDDDIFHFIEEEKLEFVCNQNINFIVKNKKTLKILPNAYISIFKDAEKLVDSVFVDKNGSYKFEADCLSNYKVVAGSGSFLESIKFVETSDRNELEKEVVIELEPAEFIVVREKVMININNIYFDYDKFNIRTDAALELDRVVSIMNKYPKLIVESGSHTDSRGPSGYNEVLSTKRANSTVNYILSKGISSDRISGKGYGETQLTNKCSNGVKCSDEAHQLNRRTEFVIINPEVIDK